MIIILLISLASAYLLAFQSAAENFTETPGLAQISDVLASDTPEFVVGHRMTFADNNPQNRGKLWTLRYFGKNESDHFIFEKVDVNGSRSVFALTNSLLFIENESLIRQYDGTTSLFPMRIGAVHHAYAIERNKRTGEESHLHIVYRVAKDAQLVDGFVCKVALNVEEYEQPKSGGPERLRHDEVRCFDQKVGFWRIILAGSTAPYPLLIQMIDTQDGSPHLFDETLR